MKRFLLALALVLVTTPAFAQTDTLKSVAFTASADQSATMSDGTAVVTRYELTIDRVANATTVPPVVGATAIAVINLNKPTPVAGVITLTNVAVPVVLTAADYVARIAAVGPGGRSADLAGPFSQPFLPRPATGLTVVR